MKEIKQYRQQSLKRSTTVIDELIDTGLRLKKENWHVPINQALTPHQALARLGAVYAQMVAPCILTLLSGGEGKMPTFDETAWLAEDYRVQEKWFEVYEGFAGLFWKMLERVRALPIENWETSARHEWYGVRTLQWWFELSLQEAEQTLAVLKLAKH